MRLADLKRRCSTFPRGNGNIAELPFAYALGGPSAAIFIKSLALPMWTGRSVSVLPGRLQLQATGLAAAIAAGSIIAGAVSLIARRVRNRGKNGACSSAA